MKILAQQYIDNVEKVNSRNDVNKEDRLFYELGHKINPNLPNSPQNWIRTGIFKEVYDVENFLSYTPNDLDDDIIRNHHNFHVLKDNKIMNTNANIIREECLKQHSKDKYLSSFVKKLRALDVEFYSDLKVYSTLPTLQKKKCLNFLCNEYEKRIRYFENTSWNHIFKNFIEFDEYKQMEYYFQQSKFLQTITLNVYHAKINSKR